MLLSVQEFVPTFLNGLTDEELKKESKTEAKNDALSGIIKALKCLVSRIPSQEDTVKNLEIFRLKVILRSAVSCSQCHCVSLVCDQMTVSVCVSLVCDQMTVSVGVSLVCDQSVSVCVTCL